MPQKLFIAVIVCLILGSGSAIFAETEKTLPDSRFYNWLNFRGPDRNGITPDFDFNPKMIEDRKNVVWKITIGRGFAPVTLRDDYLYTSGQERMNNIAYCLDVKTGKEIWRHVSKAPKTPNIGPYASLTIDGDYVYCLYQHGVLYCLDARTGKEVWQKDLIKEYKATMTSFGFASSCIIDGDTLLLNAGKSGMALNKRTGAALWTTGPGLCGYASPVVFTRDDRQLAAIFAGAALFIMDIDTGKEVGSFKWDTWDATNVADPIIAGDRIFLSSDYGYGCGLLKFDGRALTRIWKNKAMHNHMDTCVLLDGYLYGNDGDDNKNWGFYKCVELATGKELWSSNQGIGWVIAVKDKLILLSRKGRLAIAQATPEEYRELAAANIIEFNCHTPPVFCRGMLFIRNSRGYLMCLKLGSWPSP